MYYRNPLSEKRKFFLEQQFARRFELDEEAIENISKAELKKRQTKLDQLLDWLGEADPTHTGKFAMWIATRYFKEMIQFPEDLDKVNQRLALFETVKQQLPPENRDINRYKSYGQLAKMLDEHTGVSKREAVRISAREGQEILFDEGPYTVIKVTSQEAATALARHTEWCVKDPSWGGGYLEWGPLYFIDKNNRRFALAWHGHCDKRYEQYEKFQEFYRLTKERQECMICGQTEAYVPGSVSCAQHYRSLQEFEYYNSYETFNHDATKEAWFIEDHPELKAKLQDFLSSSDCESRYDVLNTYDDPLEDDEYQDILPILVQIFTPNIALTHRRVLTHFYEGVRVGGKDQRGNKEIEKQLLATKDPAKIVDYFAYLVKEKKEHAGIDGYGSARRRWRRRLRRRKGIKRKDKKPPTLRLQRWKQAEKIIFTDFQQAGRYYAVMHGHLSKEDENELRRLGADLDFTAQLPKSLSQIDTLEQIPEEGRDWRRYSLEGNQKRLHEKKQKKRASLRARIEKAQSEIDELDEVYSPRLDKAAAKLQKYELKKNRDKKLLAASIKKMEMKLEQGAPIYQTLIPLAKKLKATFNVDPDGPPGFDEEKRQHDYHPVNQYLLDLVNYYSKGMVEIPAYTPGISGEKPILLSAEDFVENLWNYIPRKRRKRASEKARKDKKALKKLGKHVRYANSVINTIRKARKY
jgi:hypothetical protein